MAVSIKRILVACDLSQQTADVLRFGAALAEQTNARMVLVHVIERHLFKRITWLNRLFRPDAPVGGLDGRMRKRRYLELERLVKEIGIAHRIERRVVTTGIAHKEILKLTDPLQIDLVIAGIGCRRQKAAGAIGHTAARIIRCSSVPVISVRHRYHREDAPTIEKALGRSAA